MGSFRDASLFTPALLFLDGRKKDWPHSSINRTYFSHATARLCPCSRSTRGLHPRFLSAFALEYCVRLGPKRSTSHKEGSSGAGAASVKELFLPLDRTS